MTNKTKKLIVYLPKRCTMAERETITTELNKLKTEYILLPNGTRAIDFYND